MSRSSTARASGLRTDRTAACRLATEGAGGFFHPVPVAAARRHVRWLRQEL
jgi:hypothetical protein